MVTHLRVSYLNDQKESPCLAINSKNLHAVVLTDFQQWCKDRQTVNIAQQIPQQDVSTTYSFNFFGKSKCSSVA